MIEFGPILKEKMNALIACVPLGFSTSDLLVNQVPEPGAAGVLIGALMLLSRRRRNSCD